MKLGVSYPQNELGGDPDALRRFAEAAEELGYEHLLMFDHVVGVMRADRAEPQPARGYDHTDPFHDPLIAFAHLAALTSRIELVTGVLVLPQRQTVLVARQSADVALLSGGRLRLGVGIGYQPVEYEAMGADWGSRGRCLDEQIPYLRALWGGQPVSFDGAFHRIDRAALVPPPAGQVPIWCGGSSEPAFRRAAALGDGFVFGYGFQDRAISDWQRVQELLRERDRSSEGFRSVFVLLAERTGSWLDRTVDALPRLRAASATDVTVVSARNQLSGIDEHIDFIARVRDRVSREYGPGFLGGLD